jgi:hypothetical protein
VGPRGVRIRCSKCHNVFAVQRPGSDDQAPPRAAPPPPSRAFEVDLDDSARARGKGPATPPPSDPFVFAGDPFAAPSADPFAAGAMSLDGMASSPSADPFAQPLSTTGSTFATDPFADAGLSLAREASPPGADPFSVPGPPADGMAEAAALLPHPALPDLFAGPASPAAAAVPPPLPKREAVAAAEDAKAETSWPGEQKPIATERLPRWLPGVAEGPPAAPGASPRVVGGRQPASVRVERDGRLRALLVSSMSVAVLLVLALGLFMFWRGEVREPRMLRASRLVGRAGEGAVAAQVSSGFYQAFDGQLLLFVRGRILVEAPPAKGAVRVRADIMKGEAVVGSAESTAGAVPSPEELAGVAGPEGAARLRALLARKAPKRVRAGEILPFLIVFTEYPSDLEGVTIRVAAEAAAAAGPG